MLGLESLAVLFECRFRRGQAGGHRSQFLFGNLQAFFGLGDVGQGLAVLGGEFAQTLFVKLDAAFVAVTLAFQLETLLLHRANLVFEFRKPFSQLGDFVLAPEHFGGSGFDLVA